MSGRFGELLLILVITLVLFGAGRLPAVMRDIGKSIKALREGLSDTQDENNKEANYTPNNQGKQDRS